MTHLWSVLSLSVLCSCATQVLSTIATETATATATECDVRSYGAVGDGVTLDDKAFASAFAACQPSQGTVHVPRGEYLLSPFNMSSNSDLFLDDGAVLLASTDFSLWPVVINLPSYPDPEGLRYGAFIGGSDIHNVTIRGTGTIDGQGQAWWDGAANGELEYGRPRLIEPMYCTQFSLIGVTVLNPPFWAVHPYACDVVLIENVNFSAPLNSPNTDGIDPDSCSNVIIRNLTATCGDDAVAIKSGKDEYGRQFNRPSYNILVEGGNIGPSRGIDIGSEMSGDVYNVVVRNTRFHGSKFAGRIKSGRGRGGKVYNVTFEDLSFEQNEMGFAITMHYSSEHPEPPMDESTPHVRDITFRRIQGSALTAGVIACLPESPCHGIVFEDINITSKVGGLECIRAFGETRGEVYPDSCLHEE